MSEVNSLPAGYLKQREQLRRREKTRTGLTASMNRYLDDGVRIFYKSTLAEIADKDWDNIKNCIAEWESRGLLRIVKPIDQAEINEVVLEMGNYIDQKRNWPN